ncbi:hypothetical protein Q8F55_004196 [Vanrija albida]|uniref:Uncharacterized protein n=1 Tax=Vanrija albida TaxID=181172 RepID=A0ABR3Q6W8_9TREE
MPRPGQQAYRAKRKFANDAAGSPSSSHNNAEEDEEGGGGAFGQALPIADLPDDFDGEVLDGATYLAVANREASKLPFYKRVAPPRGATEELPSAAAGPSTSARAPSKGRHPALPRESWEVTFAAHFTAYRASLQRRWPPSPKLPYPLSYPPIPKAAENTEWLGYINGYRQRGSKKWGDPDVSRWGGEGRRVDDLTAAGAGEGNGDEEEEAQNNATPSEEADVNGDTDEQMAVDDEEAFMNAPPPPVPTTPEYPDPNDPVELERIRPREPLVCIVQFLDTHTILSVIKHLTRWMTDFVSRLPADRGSLAASPLPARWARWAFALLAVLDAHLSRDEISILRDFARACAAVAAWRWRRALSHPGELPIIPVYMGFSPDEPVAQADKDEVAEKTAALTRGETGNEEDGPAEGWRLGARWKRIRDVRPRSETNPAPESAEAGHDEGAVDETLARAWIAAYAVVAGWAQWDLLDDFKRDFAKLARA